MNEEIDLGSMGEGLVKSVDGIWYTGKAASEISYPIDGNESCFEFEDSSFWFKHRNRCIETLVERYCDKSDLFLDVGGGNGVVSNALESAGFSTVLVEPGANGVRNARARGLDRVVCSTLEESGFYANSFHAAGAFDVVEHIQDDRHFLETVRSYLVPQGCLLVTVPAYRFLWSEEDNQAGHYRRYTVPMLSQLVEKAGFEVLYASYFFRFLPIPIFVMRSLPYLLGLRRGRADDGVEANTHVVKNRLVSKLQDKMHDVETRDLKNNKEISFGGSCILVARSLK